MPDPEIPNTPVLSMINDSLKTWTIALITLTFLILYVLFIAGKIPNDNTQYLQPIFLVIVGYYFGRVPSAQVESSLKEQVAVQSNAAAAARQSEKKAAMEREMLEEKVKNARIALDTTALESAAGGNNNAAAIRILSS